MNRITAKTIPLGKTFYKQDDKTIELAASDKTLPSDFDDDTILFFGYQESGRIRLIVPS